MKEERDRDGGGGGGKVLQCEGLLFCCFRSAIVRCIRCHGGS